MPAALIADTSSRNRKKVRTMENNKMQIKRVGTSEDTDRWFGEVLEQEYNQNIEVFLANIEKKDRIGEGS